jgi:hypothetical protein
MNVGQLGNENAHSTKTSDEALKLLVNMIAKIEKVEEVFIEEKGLEDIIEKIKVFIDIVKHYSLPAAFRFNNATNVSTWQNSLPSFS